MVLVRGMGIGVRSVVSTLLLLFVIIYVFAILCTQLVGDDNSDFKTVPASMNQLMLMGALPDQADAFNTLLKQSVSCYIIMLAYLTIAALSIMNMLIAVMCEVVGVVAEVEKAEK